MHSFNVKEVKDLFKTMDEITPQDIQNAAKEYLNKPSQISIKANKDVLEANKDYLVTIGEVV